MARKTKKTTAVNTIRNARWKSRRQYSGELEDIVLVHPYTKLALKCPVSPLGLMIAMMPALERGPCLPGPCPGHAEYRQQ